MTDILSANETQVCQVGQVVVNVGADVWVTWANGASKTGCQIGICARQTYPGNPIAVVTLGRIPWASYNLGAGLEGPIVAGVYPTRGSSGTVIGQCDPAGEITVLPSFVGQGVPFSPSPGLPGQFFVTNNTPATAWTSLSGDTTSSSSSPGAVTVTGLQGRPFSNVTPSANWVPVFNGSAWVPQALTTAQLPALAGDVTGNPGATTVVSISGSAGSATLNANLSAGQDNTLSVGSNTSRLKVVSATTFVTFNAAGDSQPTSLLVSDQLSFGAGGSAPQDARIYRSAPGQLTIDNAGGANANLVVQGKTSLQSGASDYTAYGASPGTSGFIRVTPNASIVSANNSLVLSTDANSNSTLAGANEVDITIQSAKSAFTNTSATFSFNGSNSLSLSTGSASFGVPLAGIVAGSTGLPLQLANTSLNVAASTNKTFNPTPTAPIQILSGTIATGVTATVVFPSIRALYLIDAANVTFQGGSSPSYLTFQTGSGAKTITTSAPSVLWLYVDGVSKVYDIAWS